MQYLVSVIKHFDWSWIGNGNGKNGNALGMGMHREWEWIGNGVGHSMIQCDTMHPPYKHNEATTNNQVLRVESFPTQEEVKRKAIEDVRSMLYNTDQLVRIAFLIADYEKKQRLVLNFLIHFNEVD